MWEKIDTKIKYWKKQFNYKGGWERLRENITKYIKR